MYIEHLSYNKTIKILYFGNKNLAQRISKSEMCSKGSKVCLILTTLL